MWPLWDGTFKSPFFLGLVSAHLDGFLAQHQPGSPWRQASVLLLRRFEALSTPVESGLSSLSVVSTYIDRATSIKGLPVSNKTRPDRQGSCSSNPGPHPHPRARKLHYEVMICFFKFLVQPGRWLPGPIHQRCHFPRSGQPVARVYILS